MEKSQKAKSKLARSRDLFDTIVMDDQRTKITTVQETRFPVPSVLDSLSHP